MTVSFSINHEDNNLSEYDGTVEAGAGVVSTSAASAMAGTNFGLESSVSAVPDQAMGYKDFGPFGDDGYIISFWFDPNSISMTTVNPTSWGSTDLTLIRVQNIAGGQPAYSNFIEMQYNGSVYVIRACIRDDGGTRRCTGNGTLNNAPQIIQMLVRKATSAIANDGELLVYVNGLLELERTDIDLFTRYGSGDRLRVGIDDIQAGISGTCYYDEIFATDFTGSSPSATAGKLKTPDAFIENQGAGAAGGAGGGAGGNIASISADGLYVYIASFNNLGFPTLIKILAALSSNGSIVFEPGAGGRIGVKTAEFEADTVFVAGQFDSTNTVEKSDDAGATFSAIDDGTFGAIRTFQIGPGDDNRILLFDGDNGDIIESLDGGETWTTINASVTQLVNSIARFDINPEEIVAGNQGDVADSINYSPNSGANLEDYQTGVYPNADATKVIAN